MISVDTAVIISALDPDDRNHELSVLKLDELGTKQPLFVSPLVFAELLGGSRASAAAAFLTARIPALWGMPPTVWEFAGKAYRDYARSSATASSHAACWRISSSPPTQNIMGCGC